MIEKLLRRIQSLPVRHELIGGRTYSYLSRDNVIALVESALQKQNTDGGEPASITGAQMDAIEAAAIAGRPLTSLPDGGDREALLALLREFICEFWIDKPTMQWQRTRIDDGVEMVHHSGDTIFLGDPNHREPPDTIRFDLIVKLANATPSLLRALYASSMCMDCPPVGYPTDKTRCDPCPRRPGEPG